MLSFDVLCNRRCVAGLINVLRQATARAEARSPLWLNIDSSGLLIFWTILRWERTFPLTSLEPMVSDMESLARSIDGLLQLAKEPDTTEMSRSVVFDPSIPTSAEALDPFLLAWLDRAQEQARALEHDYLGTEHILLAIFESTDPSLATVLRDHGLSYKKFKEAILKRLAESPPQRVYTPKQKKRKFTWNWTSWDTPAVGVPHRFGMAVLMMLVTMYSFLFATMRAFNARPDIFIVVALLFTGVGLGQMLLFRGKYPRAASVYVGAILFPTECVIAIIYFANSSNGLGVEPLGLICSALILGIPFGALFGYLVGGLTAGAFLIIEWYFKSPEEEVAEEIESEDDVEISSTPDIRPK